MLVDLQFLFIVVIRYVVAVVVCHSIGDWRKRERTSSDVDKSREWSSQPFVVCDRRGAVLLWFNEQKSSKKSDKKQKVFESTYCVGLIPFETVSNILENTKSKYG